MTENTENTENTEPTTPDPDDLPAAPDDAPEDTATGWAVYDRTLGQYVTGVSTDKPSKAAAAKAVPEGHTAAIVRV